MDPYSDNIVFVDTEFSGLEFYLGELISIGLVKLTGEELVLRTRVRGTRERLRPAERPAAPEREDSVDW